MGNLVLVEIFHATSADVSAEWDGWTAWLVRDEGASVDVARPRYPVELEQEYHTLVDRKMQGTLTPAEAARLQEVRDEIDRHDEGSPKLQGMQEFADTISRQIAELRQTIEALPPR